MSKGGPDTKRKHWSVKAHESLVCRNHEGHFCLNVEGGAEGGLFPFVGELRQDRIHYQSGKLYHGEILLEVNHKRVPGMIKKDVIALIKRSADPVSLVTVKQNATITKDIRQYLGTRFSKGSVDSELQHQIRENLHMRVVPCTTRQTQEGERQGVDYNFISVEEFKQMERSGDLLESGAFEGNYYGTPKPLPDPSSSNMPHFIRSSASAGYSRQGVAPPPSIGGRGPPGGGYIPAIHIPKQLGPLPPNWEIAYTENNEKYFIDHNTGTTHWLDPRLARYLKHNVLECEETELPYGWERVNDPMYGVYFIDHINRVTQYDNPVVDAKRKYAGSQLPQRTGLPSYSDRGPPSIQNTAAMEKQREAEAAMMWPDAGLRDFQDGGYPYPYQQPSEQDLEAELQGDVIRVVLTKTAQGFGFTIIGGDRPGELLQIKSVVRGSAADRDGSLQVGDVLVRINGISVLGYSHRKVVELFQSLPLNCEVNIEVRRGYPLPDYRGEDLPPYQDPSRDYQNTVPHIRSASFGDPPQPQPQPQLSNTPHERIAINIVKGPLGFGFSLGESPHGPMVKQIMDHPRCAQLNMGDIILEVNGEKVTSYQHSDLVTVLKRCPKGNQATFTVLRMPPQPEESLPHYPVSDGYLATQHGRQNFDEPFSSLEIRLMRQVSGFGFRIIGGKEEGSQATVGAIVAGGAADLDGRLQIGDEITHINGRSVLDASHRDVISLMGTASAQGEVVLSIRRKMPMPESAPAPFGSGPLLDSSNMSAPAGIRDVVIDRPNLQTSFGFVLQSNTLRAGCMICRLIPDSPADKCQQLYTYDEVLAVNGQDVSTMDHGDVVALIKSSGTTIRLTVQQPEDLELVERQQMMNDQGQEAPQGQPQGQLQYRGPDQGDGRRQFQDFGGHGYQYDEEVGPQISADFEDIGSDDEEIQHIDIHRDEGGFGFSIRGGAEYAAPLCVLRIADRGAAVNDGRLKVGDELLEINGNSTEGMLHSDAITIIKHGGDLVRLIVRRVNEHDESFGRGGAYPSGHRVSGGAPNGTGREVMSPPSAATRDQYAKAYHGAGDASLSPTHRH